MKARILLIISLLCAFAGKGWANPMSSVEVDIVGHTDGSVYRYVISSTAVGGGSTPYGPSEGTSVFLNTSALSIIGNGYTIQLLGRLNFANSSQGTDVISGNSFEVTFTSAYYYFVDAFVETLNHVAVEGCTISAKYNKTLTITIPQNKAFARINLIMANRTPLQYCTIEGIEDSYIDDGVNQPEPTVTLEGKTLRKDVDYTVSYTYSKTGGTVTVTGIGEYVGSNSKNFGLSQPTLSDLHSLGNNTYEIASRKDLYYLARIVNGKSMVTQGNSCSGKTFRQTADIAYSSNSAWDETGDYDSNFLPVGTYGHSFQGTYDGQGHTISGIRICETIYGDNAKSLALFGFLGDEGTVKNVVLRDANIMGFDNIGGLVGYSNGTVTDCYLYHVRVHSEQSNDRRNLLVGNKGGTVSRTHYRDCCEYHYGSGVEYDDYNFNVYMSSVFSLTAGINVVLPTRTGGTEFSSGDIIIYDDGVTDGDNRYYGGGTVLSLTFGGSVPEGYWPSFTAISGGNNITRTNLYGSIFTMPASDVTVNFGQFLPIVTYLDGDGVEQQCSSYVPITSSNTEVNLGISGSTRWYVVGSDATITGILRFADTNDHLILCDGATLAVSRSSMCIHIDGNLTIYGQEQGTGTLNVSSKQGTAIDTYGSITILGGKVSAATNPTSAHGISADRSKSVVTLGWTRPANSITATNYDCTIVKVKDGQTLWNGTEALSGTITDMTKLDGKTLIPYISSEITRSLTANQATFDGQTHYWTTFYHPMWSYALPAGARAFYMKNDHALYRVGDGSVIPAGCAVVIMAESASIELTATTADVPTVTGNILQGTSAATTAPAGTHVMGKVSDTFGFFEYSGEIPANKAYYAE